MDEPLRQEMEARFGADFSTVRIHSDPAAERSATAVDAGAYTSDEHIVGGPGALDRRTIVHELTHVLQQRSGPVAGNDHGDGLRVSDPSDRFEREADAQTQRVMSGQAATEPQSRPSAVRAPGPAEPTTAVVLQRYGGAQGLHPSRAGENWTNFSPPETDSLAYVAIAPVGAIPTTANRHFDYQHVAVRSVHISDVRGYTRYGKEGQKSHTTAWTLTRKALSGLAGLNGADFVAYIAARRDELANVTVTREHTSVAGQFTAGLTALQDRVNDITANSRPLHLWQPALSGLLTEYVKTYQLSPMTTYANGRAVSRNEADAMATLRDLESASMIDVGSAKLATAQLQDYKKNSSLPDANFESANHHFWVTLHTAFPKVANGLAAQIDGTVQSGSNSYQFHAQPSSFTAPTLGDSVASSSNFTLPASTPRAGTTVSYQLSSGRLDAGFGVDAFVSPQNMSDAASVDPGLANAFNVSRILLSKTQRPRAQSVPQRAHRAAWALIHRATQQQEGKSVNDVVTWVQEGLNEIQEYAPTLVADAWNNLFQQVTDLNHHAAGANLPAHQWSELVSALLQGYVMLYNASSIATGSPTAGDDHAAGHGEPAPLSFLREMAATYNSATPPSDDQKRAAREAALGLFDTSSLRTSMLVDHMFGKPSVTFAMVLDSTTNARYLATQLEVTASINAWLRFLRAAYAPLFTPPGVLDETSLRNAADAQLRKADLTSSEGMVTELSATRSGKRLRQEDIEPSTTPSGKRQRQDPPAPQRKTGRRPAPKGRTRARRR
ncbi:eCIS core domain-containing protein [Streptomyces sp. NPDC002491]